jgi:hypothetical protein
VREEVFNNTPHFYSLPQGERKLKRNSRKEEREDFNKPLTLPSPAEWRGKKGKGEILTAPLTLTLSRRWRGRKSEIFLTAPLTFVLSRKGRERMKEKILFYIGRGGFYRGVGEDEECDRVIISLGS